MVEPDFEPRLFTARDQERLPVLSSTPGYPQERNENASPHRGLYLNVYSVLFTTAKKRKQFSDH